MVDQARDVESIRSLCNCWEHPGTVSLLSTVQNRGCPFLGSAHTLAKGLISGTFGFEPVASHGSCRARPGIFQGEKDMPTALRALNGAVRFESFELV